MFWVIAFLPFFARPGRKHLFGVEERYSMKTEVKCEMDLLGLWFNFWHKGLRVATLAYKAEALELQKQVRHIQSQFDMHTGQASSLIQGRRARVAATSTVNGHHTDLDESFSEKFRAAFLRCMNTAEAEDEADDSGALAAVGCLHAISTILESVSRLPQLFVQVEPTLVPIMRRMLNK